MADLREKLADVQHDIWSHWMKYLFSCCTENEDGSVTIPADKVSRWKRQMTTDYAKLSDREQESDRHEADKTLAVVAKSRESGRKTLMRQIHKEITENFKDDDTFIESEYIKLRLTGRAAKDIDYDMCHIWR